MQNKARDKSADVWSFGVVLWQIFSYGEWPFKEMSRDEILKFIMAGKRLDKPLHCPKIIYKIMKKCWCEDPEKRPNFDLLIHVLDNLAKFLRDQPLQVTQWIPNTSKHTVDLYRYRFVEVYESSTMYVSRALNKGAFIPGKTDLQNFWICHAGKEIRSNSGEILCVPLNRKLGWVPNTHKIDFNHAVKGGYDIDNCPLYVCRVFEFGQWISGKCKNQDLMWYPYADKEHVSKNFEILIIR